MFCNIGVVDSGVGINHLLNPRRGLWVEILTKYSFPVSSPVIWKESSVGNYKPVNP